MKKKWINRKGNMACILFFNGWGMDEQVLNGIDHSGFDVCHLNDFSDTDPFQAVDFPYDKIIVVAWSLGVCFASNILSVSKLKITQSLAINGTPLAWHDELAIPHATFKQTLDGWNNRNRFKFNLRMFGGKSELEKAAKQLSQRSNESQKSELEYFYRLGHPAPVPNFSWDRTVVGMNDQIVPPTHQLRFWEANTKVIRTDWNHYPFFDITNWHELFKLTGNVY
jgi:biotin synthesis protein BioG